MRIKSVKKLLCMMCVVGCVWVNSALAKITYIDAEEGNTTVNGAALEDGVNCTIETTRSNTDGLWAFRTDRSDMNGVGIWVTDGGEDTGDKETTDPLKVTITLPEAETMYDLYAVIMNNGSGSGYWDISARIGDDGDFAMFNKNSDEMTQALATDFEGDVTVSGSSDMTMKVLIGRYTTTTANESVNIYVNGLDTWETGSDIDQRTRFDGLGYDYAAVYPVSPEDGTDEVAVDGASLSWLGGYDPNAVGFYVNLGTDEDSLICLNADSILAVGTTGYVFADGDIEMNNTYYWQIETAMDYGSGAYSAGDPNNTFSPVWSFTTVYSIPIINHDPNDQVVDLDGTAEFEVEVESLSEVTYAWYRSVDDPNNNTSSDDEVLVDGDKYSIDDNVLQVLDVTVDDEGYYYCVANNESGTPATSEVAKLAVKRLMAHWTFDEADYDAVNNEYLDVSGEGHPAEPNGVPTFATGQVGDSISIVCEDGAEEPDTQSFAGAGTWAPSEYSGMLTISFWAKWYGPDMGSYTTQNLMCKGSEDGVDWRILTNSSGNLVMSSSNYTLNYSSAFLEIDTWVHGAISFDGSYAYFYKNGDYVGKGTFVLGDLEDTMITLGGKYFDGIAEGWFNGELDEVRIYNYEVSDVDIARIYVTDEPEGSVCVNSLQPDSSFDTNDDCVVDLKDFSEFASHWLECGLIPDCDD